MQNEKVSVNMKNLRDYTLQELEGILKEMGEPKFRAKQIFKWFSRGVTRLEEMTDISAKTYLVFFLKENRFTKWRQPTSI